MLPVLDYQISFKKPAFYDEVLTIKTKIPKFPQARIYFEYETFNEKQELINTASTTLVFVNKNSGKPIMAPSRFLNLMEPYLPLCPLLNQGQNLDDINMYLGTYTKD